MKVKIKFFAVTKDYFGEDMELEANNLNEIKQELINSNNSSKAILETCKFVIDSTIIDESYILKSGDLIVVLPPSSGG